MRTSLRDALSFNPICLCLLVSAVGSLSAQQAAVPPDLTLAQAVDIARDNHPAYRVLDARLDAAAAEERGAAWWLQMLPTVSFGGGVSVTHSSVLTGTDEFGRPIQLDEPLSYRRTDSDLGPYIGQLTFFDSGNTIRSARATRAGVRSTRAGIELQQMQLESQVIRRYREAVQADRQIELEQRSVSSVENQLEVTRRLMSVGATDPLDVLQVEVDLADANYRLEAARGSSRKAALALRDALGVAADASFRLVDELPDVFDPTTLNVDDLVASALGESATLMQVEASAEQARINLSDARAQRWPNVTAFLRTRFGTTLGSGSDPLFYLNPLNQTYTLGVSVQLDLFDRFATSRQIAQARANNLAAEENVRNQRRQTEMAVRGALIDLENAHRAVELREAREELARRRLDLAEEQYRLGGMPYLDLQTATDVAYGAELDAITARYEFAAALLSLEEAVGRRIR